MLSINAEIVTPLPSSSEKEELVATARRLRGLLLEVVVEIDEGIVGVVQHKFEVFEKLILVGRHYVSQKGIAALLLKNR